MLIESLTLNSSDLVALSQTYATLAIFMQETSAHTDASASLVDIMKSHVLPPAALGSKRTDVLCKSEYKLYNVACTSGYCGCYINFHKYNL